MKVKTWYIYKTERNGIKKWGESPLLIFGEELKCHFMEKNGQVVEATKDLFKGYRKKSKFMEK